MTEHNHLAEPEKVDMEVARSAARKQAMAQPKSTAVQVAATVLDSEGAGSSSVPSNASLKRTVWNARKSDREKRPHVAAPSGLQYVALDGSWLGLGNVLQLGG